MYITAKPHIPKKKIIYKKKEIIKYPVLTEKRASVKINRTIPEWAVRDIYDASNKNSQNLYEYFY